MKKVLSAVLAGIMAVSTAAAVSAESTSFTGDYGEVKLGTYKGLEADQYTYEVTDEDVDDTISSMLYEYADYTEVTTGAAEENIVTVNMTGTVSDELVIDYSEETTDIYLGYQQYGEEFDNQLIGSKAGDTLEFSVSYDSDDETAICPGETVDYSVTVISVVEETIPELTEDFVENTLEYESEEAMREEIKTEKEQENLENSLSDVKADLLTQVIDGSEFVSLDETKVEEEIADVNAQYESYLEYFGVDTVEELYDSLGMTEDDITEEAKSYVEEKLVVEAIADAEGLSISDDEYNEGAANYAVEYGYDSTEDFISEAGEDQIRFALLEDKVLDLLYDNAVITEVAADDESEFVMDDEFDSEAEELSDEDFTDAEFEEEFEDDEADEEEDDSAEADSEEEAESDAE